MKKVLFIIPTLTQTNGVAAFIVNYLSRFKLNNFEVEVIYNNLRPAQKYIDFFKSKGIRTYALPYVRDVGLKNYKEKIKKFFKEHHDYELIYSNVGYQTYFFYNEVKKYNLKKFAIHAHGTQSSDNALKNILGGFLQAKINKFCNYKLACSKLAGEGLFKSNDFKVINNAIDYNNFKFNNDYRKKLRKNFHIDDEKKIIGFVGRFVVQKNIFFFIELAKRLDSEYKIMMIGTGILKNDFIKKIKEYDIENKFIFIDEISNVNEYYSMFDYFLLPSLFEGLPVVGVEAQANGLPCLFSDTISNECKISENVVYLDRNNVDDWLENIDKMARNNNLKLNDDFNIDIQAKKFEDLLSKIVEE